MTAEKLKEMLKLHKLWLQDNKKGERLNLSHKDLRKPSLNKLLKSASLSYADLSHTNLNDADLSDAILINTNLHCANLNNVNLSRADLSRADLSCANLSYANLSYTSLFVTNLSNANLFRANLYCANMSESCLKFADLTEADLSKAMLYTANLHCANLRNANLYDADLKGANLYDADLKGANNIPPIRLACPDTGSFIGWKKVQGYIIKLRIPSKAKRCSATTNKCRCEYAKVLKIQNLDGSKAAVNEVFNNNYAGCTYRIGEIIYPDKFDPYRWNECSNGIHFFINRQEAVDY